MNRDFKGIWIPREIWLREDLSILDKAIYAEICSLDNEDHCTASNEYFAEFCHVSVATVKRTIKTLKDAGLIEVVSFDGRRRQLKMSQPPAQNEPSHSSKCATINIDNNTINKNTISKDIVITNDVDDKIYSSSDFIGSAKKKSTRNKPKKKSLYSQCVNEIDQFTTNVKLYNILVRFLEFRLENKEKPIYFNMWKSMLDKLNSFSSDTDVLCSIVQQSLDKGWLSFYELKSSKRPSGLNVFGETSEISADKVAREEMSIREEGF